MRARAIPLAAALAAGAALTAPAAALAASATVTADDGVTPVPLGTPVLRNMAPQVAFAFAGTERRYSAVVTGPGGQAASSGTDCGATSATTPERVRYQGNGTYTVTVRTSPSATDLDCSQATAPQTFAFTINAFSAVTVPAARLLTRQPLTTDALTYPFRAELNPNAGGTELRYAAGATIGADGGIAGDSEQAVVNATTGEARVSFTKPGVYTFVARATDPFGAGFSTPWSMPAQVTVLAPFDFVSQPSFADSRGPSYRLTGTVRESSARGRVRVSIARGLKKSAKFRRVATVRIRAQGRLSVRFRLTRQGVYRVRYAFEGSKTVAGGSIVQRIRIFRQVILG
jgi:hypothetical protein